MDLSPEALVRLLSDPRRVKVLAAVALGARTPADVVAASGLPVKAATTARLRLLEDGLLVDDGGLSVAYPALRALAARLQPAEPEGGLAPFVRGERLVSLPAQDGRRRLVLAHVAQAAFAPGRSYAEPEVNALLGAWCAGGAVDHAALRRYLVEGGLVHRASGVYRLVEPGVALEPDPAQRRLEALGLA